MAGRTKAGTLTEDYGSWIDWDLMVTEFPLDLCIRWMTKANGRDQGGQESSWGNRENADLYILKNEWNLFGRVRLAAPYQNRRLTGGFGSSIIFCLRPKCIDAVMHTTNSLALEVVKNTYKR